MQAHDINTKIPEGRLLTVAVSILKNFGPPETKDKQPDEILDILGKAADALEHIKM